MCLGHTSRHCLGVPLRNRISEYRASPSSAAARDVVKKKALRKAGVGYHELVAGQTKPKELRRLVERLVST